MKPVTFMGFLAHVGVRPESGQEVYWSVDADGVQPCDFKGDARELARAFFGNVETIPAEARATVAVIKGAEIGFSYFGGLRLLHRALTADIRGAAPGVPRVAVSVAPDMRLARGPVGYALAVAQSQKDIRALLEDVTADGFSIRREAGRMTRVMALPASAGGRATRGRRYIEALMDEAEFFRDKASGVVNDADIYSSIVTRNKGQTRIGSTPWAGGLLKQLFDTNFGAPRTALAARLPTLLMRSDRRVRSAVQAEMSRDPVTAAREFSCEFLTHGAGLYFDGGAIERSIDPDLPNPLPPGWRDAA